MVTGRDSSCMITSNLFTKQVHFHACKSQLKTYWILSHEKEIPHITINAQQIQPGSSRACQVKPFPESASNKTTEISA